MLLERLSFALQPGELKAVVGPSGSGKSTLLLAMAGLIDPAAGEVLLRERDGHDWGYAAFRRRVVYVPQKPTLLETTVRHNLERVFAYHSAEGAAFDVDAAGVLFERFRLPLAYFEKDAQELSVGEQQRLCLIRSLLVEPQVLLLDEPTSALDAANRELVEHLLLELAMERCLAAIVVTHDEEQAARLCTQTIDLTQYLSATATMTEEASA